MKNRIEWVDIGKYICIMFVMLSHLESGTDVLRTFYTPFFLTVFFFLSGYVYKQPSSFRGHLIKKVKGLLVPWFILSNLNILLSVLKGAVDYKKRLFWNMVQIRPYGDIMWFVVALFVAYIPFYYVIRMDDREKAIVVSFVLSVISYSYSVFMPNNIFPWGNPSLPWHLEYIFRAMFWMVLGYYYHHYYEEKLESYNNLIVSITIAVTYLLLIYCTAGIETKVLKIALSYMDSILGIAFIVLICKNCSTNRYVAYVGSNTIIFFAFHGKCYALIQYLLHSKMGGFYNTCLSNTLYSSILAIVITLLMSFILIIPAYVINGWFPWIVGRQKK